MALIPSNNALSVNIDDSRFPSKTYKLDFSNKRIVGNVDGIHAISQTVIKILNTERYRLLIYDWDYGHEINSLVGKNSDYIKAELRRIIKDALIVDDRILDVTNFVFNDNLTGKVPIKFTVLSIEGDIDMEVIVSV